MTENGNHLENYDMVRFDSKDLKTADFIFKNVIPGKSSVTFKNVPLTETEKGWEFKMDYVVDKKTVVIEGTVTLGMMSVNIIS